MKNSNELLSNQSMEETTMTLPRISKKMLAKITRMIDTDPLFKRPMRWGRRFRPDGAREPEAEKPVQAVDRNGDIRYVPEPIKLDVSSILVPEGHREIDKDAIDGLADSIQAIGLQHPITIRRGNDGTCLLVAGRHRLEAYKRLGIPRISARIMDERLGRLWSISENLHRVDQSQLDRADAIASYAKERGLLEGGPRAQPGGKQPNDRGNSRTAKALRMDRKQVRQARKHADICPEAKKLLRLNGLDNSTKALNSVADCKTPEAQVAKVKAVVEGQKERGSSRSRAKSMGGGPRGNGLAATASFLKLKQQWEPLAFRKNFENSPPEARRRFIKEVLSTVA